VSGVEPSVTSGLLSGGAGCADARGYKVRTSPETTDRMHVSEANGTIASLNAKANAPRQDDRAQVMQVLDAYKAGFEAKDLNKLAAVWPGVPRNQLQTTFRQLSQKYRIL